MWLGLSLTLSLHAADTFSSAYVSEFLADNRRGLKDEDGDRSGWIEIASGAREPITLEGWFLTDSPTNLTKWRFPRVSLLPGKFLVVFASGKDRGTNVARLHTNFRLDPKGSYLALVHPSKNVVSEFAPTNTAADQSFGRVQGEPILRGALARPTPGKPNAITGEGFAPEVVFSRSGGTFTEPFPLVLSTIPPGAIIRYTLDGRLPQRDSPAFSTPLLITNTAEIRARAYQEGLLPGPPQSETYLLLHTNVLDFTSTLPVLVMNTLGRDTHVSPRFALVQMAFFEPGFGRTSLTNPPEVTTRAAFRVRGSTSAGMPQHPYAVQFLDEFNEEKNRRVLSLPAESDWVLYAPNGYDPGMIHNPFVHQLSRDMGRYSPRTRFVEVFLSHQPGPITARHYHGLYVLEEKIKIGKHRLAIDEAGPEDLAPPGVTGGYLLKFDRLGPGEGGFSAGGASMVYVDPREQVMRQAERAPQRDYLNRFFEDFARALHGPEWKDPVRGYRAFFDVEASIDFHVLEVLSGNVDSQGLSTYFHKPRNGKLTFGPHWDFDRALGSTDGRDANPRNWNTGPFFGGPWWPRLFSDVDVWQRWVDRWQELRRAQFSLGHMCALIDRLADEVSDAHPREVKRWGLHPRGGSFASEINLMKDWLSNRVDFIDRQLSQPPVPSHPSGRVQPGLAITLAAPTNATIYFTTDGSDPRLPQGGVASNALVFAGPILVRSNLHLVARARDPRKRQEGGPPSSTPWSGPVNLQFELAAPSR